MVQRRAVPVFWLGDEDELVRTFAAFEGVRAARGDEVVVAVRAGEGVRGFARIEGEGVTAAFAEVVKDFCAALVCQFGVIRGVEVRAEVDGRVAISQGGQGVVLAQSCAFSA